MLGGLIVVGTIIQNECGWRWYGGTYDCYM